MPLDILLLENNPSAHLDEEDDDEKDDIDEECPLDIAAKLCCWRWCLPLLLWWPKTEEEEEEEVEKVLAALEELYCIREERLILVWQKKRKEFL